MKCLLPIPVFAFLLAFPVAAKESPTELPAKRYVQTGVETLRTRLLGKQEQLILNTVWAQSTDVLDDVYEADLLRRLRKQGFDPAGIEYDAKSPYRVTIHEGGGKAVLEVKNLFLGHYEWNGQPIVLSDFQSAPALHGRLLEILKPKKRVAIDDWLVPEAKAAYENPEGIAGAGYFVLTSISASLNGDDCDQRFRAAEGQVRNAMRSCQGELAQVQADPKVYSRTKSRALQANLTDVLAGYRFSEIRERSCVYLGNGVKYRAGWAHFQAKHSCVVGFESYCARIDDLVSCHSQMRAAAGVRAGAVVVSRDAAVKQGVKTEPSAVKPEKSDSAR